jgi:hypothetical protein
LRLFLRGLKASAPSEISKLEQRLYHFHRGCSVPSLQRPGAPVYTFIVARFSAPAFLMEFLMERFSSALALLAGIVLTAASLPAQTPSQRLELDRKGETIVLEPYAPNILRVTISQKREPALAAPGYGFVAAPAAAGWSASQTPKADIYQSDGIVATVPTSSARFRTRTSRSRRRGARSCWR